MNRFPNCPICDTFLRLGGNFSQLIVFFQPVIKGSMVALPIVVQLVGHHSPKVKAAGSVPLRVHGQVVGWSPVGVGATGDGSMLLFFSVPSFPLSKNR